MHAVKFSLIYFLATIIILNNTSNKSLQPALERARRQSTSSPLTNSFAFNDTNIYGYIRYSGAYSKVS